MLSLSRGSKRPLMTRMDVRSSSELERFVLVASRGQRVVARFERGVAAKWLGLRELDASEWAPSAVLERAVRAGLSESEIQVQVSRRGVFFGDEARRQSTVLRLGSILSAAAGDDWLREAADGLEFYAAQVPVAQVDARTGAVEQQQLGNLFPGIVAAAPLAAAAAAPGTRVRVAAWIGAGATTSPAHFDDDDNILLVLSGRKTVRLAWPFEVEPLACWSASPNHAASPKMPDDALSVVLEPGQSLFIPRGVWHEVASAPATIALNAWFKMPRQSADATHVARSALVRLARAAVRNRLHRLDSIARLRALARRDGWTAVVERAAREDDAELAAALWHRSETCTSSVSWRPPPALAPRLRRSRDRFARACFFAAARRALRADDARRRAARSLAARRRLWGLSKWRRLMLTPRRPRRRRIPPISC